MKSLKKILVLLIASLFLAGCGKISDIHLTNYKIASVSPVGLRGLDVALDLGIDNPSLQFTVSDITAELFRDGKSIGTYASPDQVLVKSKTVAEYRVTGRIMLSDGVSLMQVLGYLSKFNVEEYSISYGANVKLKSGLHARVQKNKVPLKELLEEKEK